MFSQKMIDEVNNLPMSDQRKVFDYIELILFHRRNNSQEDSKSCDEINNDKIKMAELYPSQEEDVYYVHVNIPEKQESIEDSFGVIKTNHSVSLEDMQQAIETMGGTLDSY